MVVVDCLVCIEIGVGMYILIVCYFFEICGGKLICINFNELEVLNFVIGFGLFFGGWEGILCFR